MVEGINGNHGPKGFAGAKKTAFGDPSFSYTGIHNHSLFMPKRGIQKSFQLNKYKMNEALESTKGLNTRILVPYTDQQSTLFFGVVEAGGTNIKLQLNSIRHTARYDMGKHYLETMRILSEKFKNEGLTVSARFNEKIWRQIDIGQESFFEDVKIKRGDTYRLKVTGGNKELCQKALLDLWLALKSEEELDLEREMAQKSEEDIVKPPVVHELKLKDIGAQKEARTSILVCDQTHLDHTKSEGFHGRVINWNYYKNFDKLRETLDESNNITLKKITDVFEYLIANYKRHRAFENRQKYADFWTLLPPMYAEIGKKLINTIGNELNIDEAKKFSVNGEILNKPEVEPLFELKMKNDCIVPLDILDKYFAKYLAVFPERNKQDIENVINYLVKGIKGESMDEFLHISKPVILCAPSLTITEALRLPENVKCVLVSDMRPQCHPYEILKARGITNFKVTGDVAAYVRSDEKIMDNYSPASVVIRHKKLWLDINIPDNLHQEHIRAQGYADREGLRTLAFSVSGFDIRIQNGNMVLLQAINRGKMNKGLYKMVSAKGVGLYTTETSHINAKRLLSESDMANELKDACELPKRITIRLEDHSTTKDPLRRDDKLIPEIENKDNLSGAAFLLCDEGQRKLLRPRLRAILRESRRWKGKEKEIKIMVPFVTNSQQMKDIRAILNECIEEVLKEENSAIKMTPQEMALARESMRSLPLGAMIENKLIITEGAKEGTYNCENIARVSDFGSIGLNDLRNSLGKDSLMDPEVVKVIDEAVNKFNRFSTHLSVCGDINGDREFLLLNMLGIEDMSVNLKQIPELSLAVRSFIKEEIDGMRVKVFKAESGQDIEKILEDGLQNIDERLVKLTQSNETEGNRLRAFAEEARLGRLRDAKIKAMDDIFNIIEDKEQGKEERIEKAIQSTLNKDEFKDESQAEMPRLDEITKWLSDEMLVISFLDEWVIRKTTEIKCRVSAYQFLHDNGEIFARAVSRGGITGTLSRYYIGYGREKEEEGEKGLLVNVNYFSRVAKETKTIRSCFAHPVKDKKDHYVVTTKEEGEAEETIEFILRNENGQNICYRKLAAEKLYVAKWLNDEIPFPSDPSIAKVQHGDVKAIFISDRIGLSSVKDPNIDAQELRKSIDRDRQNLYYQPADPEKASPFNVNQLLFIKMRQLNGHLDYVTMVDNWLENKKGKFRKLPGGHHLEKIIKFLGIEMEEDKMLLERIAKIREKDATIREKDMTIESLKKEIDIQKKQLEAQSAQANKS